MLAKVPKKLLSAADESAKQLRRQLMRGATVVFVTAGLPGKKWRAQRGERSAERVFRKLISIVFDGFLAHFGRF